MFHLLMMTVVLVVAVSEECFIAERDVPRHEVYSVYDSFHVLLNDWL